MSLKCLPCSKDYPIIISEILNMALLRQVIKLTPLARSAPVALYHEKVIDHYENPRNVGKLDPKNPNVGTGLVGAPACGDVMKLQIEVLNALFDISVDRLYPRWMTVERL